jgi:hypothetical protein
MYQPHVSFKETVTTDSRVQRAIAVPKMKTRMLDRSSFERRDITSGIHLLADENGLPIAFRITPGQTAEYAEAVLLLEGRQAASSTKVTIPPRSSPRSRA